MARRAKMTGMKELQQKLKALKGEALTKAAQRGTAVMSRVVRDEAKKSVHKAPKAWTVYYGSKKSKRQKLTYAPGSVASVVIIKRLPKSELSKRFLSKHVLTVKRGNKPALERAALMMEYKVKRKKRSFKPFIKPSLRRKRKEALADASAVISEEILKAWIK